MLFSFQWCAQVPIQMNIIHTLLSKHCEVFKGWLNLWHCCFISLALLPGEDPSRVTLPLLFLCPSPCTPPPSHRESRRGWHLVSLERGWWGAWFDLVCWGLREPVTMRAARMNGCCRRRALRGVESERFDFDYPAKIYFLLVMTGWWILEITAPLLDSSVPIGVMSHWKSHLVKWGVTCSPTDLPSQDSLTVVTQRCSVLPKVPLLTQESR